MKGARMIGWILLLLIVGFVAYVRLAPHDAQRWHVPVTAESDKTMKWGAIRVLPAGPDTLAQVDAAARALDRTQVLAGSVDEGRITYVTRSRLFGFPDYTTVEQSDGKVRMMARLRFGRSDMGVNAARLERIKAAVE